MKHYFYHLTDRASLPQIMKEGLVPQIGPRSEIVCEEEPMICLGKRKDMAYWQILLGALQKENGTFPQSPAILRVDVEEGGLEKYQYSYYDEYISRDPISPDRLKRVYLPTPGMQQMKNLCTSYLYSLSDLVVYIARYYNKMWKYGKEEIERELDIVLDAMSRLNYKSMTWREIRQELQEAGENGAYTFCDWYYQTGRRLWEQLILYPEDDLTEKRKKLYQIFKTTFTPGCLHVETGGWSGTW